MRDPEQSTEDSFDEGERRIVVFVIVVRKEDISTCFFETNEYVVEKYRRQNRNEPDRGV